MGGELAGRKTSVGGKGLRTGISVSFKAAAPEIHDRIILHSTLTRLDRQRLEMDPRRDVYICEVTLPYPSLFPPPPTPVSPCGLSPRKILEYREESKHGRT